MMSTVRSFIAPDLPQSVKRHLEQVSHNLSERILDVRWVRPYGVYQTLKFFGDVEAERVPGIARSIDQAASGEDGSDLSCTTTGVFPKPA